MLPRGWCWPVVPIAAARLSVNASDCLWQLAHDWRRLTERRVS
jgi:hypothetical protein